MTNESCYTVKMVVADLVHAFDEHELHKGFGGHKRLFILRVSLHYIYTLSSLCCCSGAPTAMYEVDVRAQWGPVEKIPGRTGGMGHSYLKST